MEIPTCTVAAAPILGPSHEQLLLENYSGPAMQWPAKSCIHNLFEFQAGSQPMAPCLVSPTARMSYGQVEARANQTAHMLKSMGVGPDIAVCILMERSVEAYVSMLGVMKAGGAYVPLVSFIPPLPHIDIPWSCFVTDVLYPVNANEQRHCCLLQQHIMEAMH